MRTVYLSGDDMKPGRPVSKEHHRLPSIARLATSTHDRDAGELPEMRGAAGGQIASKNGKRHGSRLRIDKSHAEKKERGRRGGENEIIEPGLEGDFAFSEISGESVESDAEDLEAKEERDEMVGGNENGRTEGGDEEKNVKLLAANILTLEIAVGHQDDGKHSGDDEAKIVERETVDDDERRHLA